MKVVFHEWDEPNGTREVGQVIYENGRISYTGEYGFALQVLLFERAGETNPKLIEAEMRGAPKRFNGNYFVAEFVE
jgi:hypothetical protein